jgi:hypothetical protein
MYNDNKESLAIQAVQAIKALITLPFLLITIIFNISKALAALTHILWKATDDAAEEVTRDKTVIIDVNPNNSMKSGRRMQWNDLPDSTIEYPLLLQVAETGHSKMYDELIVFTNVDRVFKDQQKFIVRFIVGETIEMAAEYRRILAQKYPSYVVSYRKGLNTDRMYVQLRPRNNICSPKS